MKRSFFPRASATLAVNANLIWGMHAVRAAWLNPKRTCKRLWLTEGAAQELAETFAHAAKAKLPRPEPRLTDRAEMDRMLPAGSVHQGVIVDVAPLPEVTLDNLVAPLSGQEPPRLLLALDQVTDPRNVGAILRSAAALGAGAILVTERHAPGLTGVMAKAASGALEVVPIVAVVNLARALEILGRANYLRVGLAEEGALRLEDLDLGERVVLVLGAEGEGLRRLTRERCDHLVHLPTRGPIGSLNVSNAAAIALYEAQRSREGGTTSSQHPIR